MKCPNCGGQMGLEDEACPYCGTPNAMAAKHQSDMARYQAEYERTQEEVLENTSFMQRHGSWLVILVILLVALVVGIGLEANAWDIGYSIRENEVERNMDAHRQALDSYLEQGDYGKFAGYYSANRIYYSDVTSYQALHTAADAYVDLMREASLFGNPSDYSSSPERIANTCDYLARDLNRIYTIESQYSYHLDEYLPPSMRVYLDDIRERTSALAVTYFGLTEEDIAEIPNISIQKLAQKIEKGVTS